MWGSPGREIFENSCMKTALLLGGRLCEVAYNNPLLPPFFSFTPINGEEGGMGACTMSVTVVQPGPRCIKLW